MIVLRVENSLKSTLGIWGKVNFLFSIFFWDFYFVFFLIHLGVRRGGLMISTVLGGFSEKGRESVGWDVGLVGFTEEGF